MPAIGVTRRSSQLMREGRLPIDESPRIAGMSRTMLYQHLTPDGSPWVVTDEISAKINGDYMQGLTG